MLPLRNDGLTHLGRHRWSTPSGVHERLAEDSPFSA